MAKTKISEFSATPANNTDIDSINIAEGCAPSGINDAIRELMAQLKDFQTGAVGDSFNGPVGTSTAAAGAFTTLAASGSVTLSGGTANGVTYLNGSKVLTSGSALTFDGTNLAVGTTPTSFGAGYSVLTVQGSTSGFVQASNGTIITEVGTFGGIGYTGTRSNHSYGFVVSGSEQMRLTSTGLGIGTSTITSGSGFTPKLVLSASDAALIVKGQNSQEASVGSSNSMYIDCIGAATGTNNNIVFRNNSTNSSFATTERARIDSSGNLLLGVTSSTGLTGTGDFAMPNNRAIRFRNAADSAYLNMIYVDTSNNLNFGFGGVPPNITFGINGIGEVSRFDSSGNLLVGTTSLANSEKFRVYTTGAEAVNFSNNDLSGSTIVTKSQTASASTHYVLGVLNSAGSVVGRITHNDTSTSFVTSSDYRLKENIAPMTGALATVAQLKPCTYTWKSNGLTGQGFIAHELKAVVSDAVVGEKDAVDANGNPEYQGIDTSFLVATLTAAIQELKAEFDAYKASHP